MVQMRSFLYYSTIDDRHKNELSAENRHPARLRVPRQTALIYIYLTVLGATIENLNYYSLWQIVILDILPA